MRKFYKQILLSTALGICSLGASAQLSTNPDKFLGNITTGWQSSMDYNGFKFSDYWNQVTPENGSKWGSVQPYNPNSFSWGGADTAYKYAKQHGFPFKFHTLIWGSQYPNWITNLSKDEQYKAIVRWMDEAQKRYPDIAMIDVVNEAIEGHAPAPFKDALGGDGETGYDWIIRAFEMAYERWPDAILIYNDYNTFQWQKTEFIDLVKTLRDAGAPIDAYGCQSHDLSDMGLSTFKSAMEEIHNALMMPMYCTEYDINKADDNQQLQRYKEQIPYMWEADYVAGITLWGWFYGSTWKDNTGLIKNKQERPALTWLREYMATDAAKQAKSPFPGMVKEASIYVKPASLKPVSKEPTTITVNARLKTKTIERVELYVNNQLLDTKTEAPYVFEYTPSSTRKCRLKAIVTATDGTSWERLSNMSPVKATGIDDISTENKPAKRYNLQGIEVGDDYKGIVIQNGRKIIQR